MQRYKSNGHLFLFSLFIVTLLLVLAGCSRNEESRNKETPLNSKNVVDEKQNPVTITFGVSANDMTEDEAKRYVINPVNKKYPWITIKRIDTSAKGQELSNLILAGTVPDLFFTGTSNITNEFVLPGLNYDMTSLIKENNFDLKRIDQVYIAALRDGSGLDYVFGLPVWNQAFALLYNKDVFDKFGASYPKDGMTWDQVRDLAAKITRNADGVAYYGLYPGDVYRGANQINLPFFDWKNEKPVFQTNEWVELFTYWYNLFKVSGYPPKNVASTDSTFSTLFTKGQLAMMYGSTSVAQNLLTATGLNWGIVTYPENPKAPGVGQRVNDKDVFITRTSAHKAEAFKVISVLLSDEVQADMSRSGRMSVLTNRDIQNQFGQALEGFQEKNAVAFTKPKLAAFPIYKTITPYNDAVTAFKSVLYDGVDINTALRKADETVVQNYLKSQGK